MKLEQQGLLKQLVIKINSLVRLCQEFDSGNHDSAIEISTVIRALVHDTQSSHSLLGQLDSKQIEFADSTGESIDRRNAIAQFTLVESLVNPITGGVYRPWKDNNIYTIWKSFNEWWGQIIAIIPGESKELSRRDLVLKLANNYGAHIGKDIPMYFDQLFNAKDNMVGFTWMVDNKHKPHEQTPLFPSIRQIAHEFLLSIAPHFTNELNIESCYLDKLEPPESTKVRLGSIGIFSDLPKSTSMIAFEALPEEEREQQIELNSNFIDELQVLFQSFESDESKVFDLIQKFKPYNYSQDELLDFCKSFAPFSSQYLSDLKSKLGVDLNLTLSTMLHQSVLICVDDANEDNDPPLDHRIIRKKYRRLIELSLQVS